MSVALAKLLSRTCSRQLLIAAVIGASIAIGQRWGSRPGFTTSPRLPACCWSYATRSRQPTIVSPNVVCRAVLPVRSSVAPGCRPRQSPPRVRRWGNTPTACRCQHGQYCRTTDASSETHLSHLRDVGVARRGMRRGAKSSRNPLGIGVRFSIKPHSNTARQASGGT